MTQPDTPTRPETIAVAMSGGVDSSAVAALLRAQGHTIVGLTLQLWNQRRLAGHEGMPEAVHGRCCSIDDVYDARRVAEHLGIPYYLVNQEARFEAEVVKPFVAEYLAGRTPIPCTLCNNHLKFDQLLLTAQQIGATRIATGHYARNHYDEARGRWILSRPEDKAKDQTYFGLNVATKPDSQEICFIPGGDYHAFLQAYLDEQGESMPDSSGELVTTSGEVLGHHTGIHSFTVGQRKGLGLTSAAPLYVLSIHPDSHQVAVGSSDELFSTECRVDRLNWISIPALTAPIRVQAKIRHRHDPQPATLSPASDGSNTAVAIFDKPQRAITPGQAAIFYQADEVVGGGWIV